MQLKRAVDPLAKRRTSRTLPSKKAPPHAPPRVTRSTSRDFVFDRCADLRPKPILLTHNWTHGDAPAAPRLSRTPADRPAPKCGGSRRLVRGGGKPLGFGQ